MKQENMLRMILNLILQSEFAIRSRKLPASRALRPNQMGKVALQLRNNRLQSLRDGAKGASSSLYSRHCASRIQDFKHACGAEGANSPTSQRGAWPSSSDNVSSSMLPAHMCSTVWQFGHLPSEVSRTCELDKGCCGTRNR